MQNFGMPGDYTIEHHGLQNLKAAYWNLSPAALIEQIVLRQEAAISNTGAVVVNTGKHTGRAPNDKFIVQYNDQSDQGVWWGKTNQPISQAHFNLVYQKMCSYLQNRDVYIQDLQTAAHPAFKTPIRLITEKAWSALFAHNLFINPTPDQIARHIPAITILHCPDFVATPAQDGTNSGTLIALDLKRGLILIAGTSYAGEIKKAVFSAMNFRLPQKGALSMHCSANVGASGDVALFFGLSGTGKTTLSSDPERRLIGDDEHGWSDDSVFNLEGGCYAKTIHLRSDLEPQIWDASRRFGSILENVGVDSLTRELDFDDDHRTENTRGAYPLNYIPNHVIEGYAGLPQNIFFLSADAFGVLPPISYLSQEQAMYYFLSGYTSKLAGTETGLSAEPQATFSTCFGAPFLPLHPRVYASMLGKKIAIHKTHVWLINTGWTGGAYGTGSRIRLPYTRAMIRAALSGELGRIPLRKDELFGLMVPTSCPDVPSDVLEPQNTWADQDAYQNQAQALIARFEKNILQYKEDLSSEIIQAGPHWLIAVD